MAITMIDTRATLPRHATKVWERRASPVSVFCIHHSATPASVTPEQIARYHVNEKDMPGIQYHYVIPPDGVVWWCNDDDRYVWHGHDWNVGLGVCLIGDFTTGEPTDAQIAAARWLYAQKQREHGPLRLVGHKEAPRASTECPGRTWEQWRDRIGEREATMKLSWHVQRIHPWMAGTAQALGLQWVKIVNPPEGIADPFPGVPNKAVRFWHDDIQAGYIRDGYEGGRQWVRDFLPRIRACSWATCFETANEPGCNGNDDLRNLRLYSLGAMREADEHGIKLCILNLPEGNPAATFTDTPEQARASERWKLAQLAEAVQYAAENGHYVGLHCYWLPDRGIGPLDRWHGLGRVEWNVQQWISMGVNSYKLRVLVNETGVDGLIEQVRAGWRSRSTLSEYARHVAEFDARAQQLDWLKAYMLFTVGFEGEWTDYEHSEGDLRTIHATLGQQPATPPTTEPPTPELPEELPTMLQNGRFDTFRYWHGIGEIWVAEDWEPFWAEYDPGRPSYDRRPEYKRCGDEADGPRRAPEGFRYGQQWFNWSGHHRAGIYQRVAATPGQKYEFHIQAMAWYSICSDGKDGLPKADPAVSYRNADDPGYGVKIGIDPTGGTDAFAAGVVWSETIYPHDAWYPLTVAAEAKGNAITVFVYGEPTWPVTNVNCYVSDAWLAQNQAPPAPPPAYALPSTDSLTLAAIESGDTYQMYQKRRWWNEHAVRLLESGDVAQALAVLRDMADREHGLDYVVERALGNAQELE